MPSPNPDVENVKVVVRCRPLNENEAKSKFKNIVEVRDLEGTVTVWNPKTADDDPPKMFTFDIVFGCDSKQLDVYNQAARPIIGNVLEGYNGTIFAYGQTGTGKTFTMEGNRDVPELKGIIPNSFAHIFGCIAKCDGDRKFLVRASYLEIYNEEVRDLLRNEQNVRLEVKERPDVGVFVKDLSTFVVHSADDLDHMMTLGNRNRAVGSTNMNIHSSRSHAIFTITVECCEDGQEHVRVGKLHLVDLAGSERQSKSGTTGQRLIEATKINLSLSTLGNVISALVDGKSTHIPYRNSKLTRLLQDSLGGNSKTVMFANIGPADYNYDETISTLRYANRAKNIKNKARINEDPKDAMIKKFQSEIDELRKQLEEGSGLTMESDEGESTEGAEDDGEFKIKKVPRKMKTMSEERMKEIEAKIEEDRKLLSEQKDMVQGERQRIADELRMREQELSQARAEHDNLMQKLQGLEKKIIVGGENLLEKAEEQEKLLEESAKELAERKAKEVQLKEALQEKEAERLDIEEKYSSLQEEAAGKTRKLKKVWQMQQSAKNELKDIRQEHQREMEGLLENIRQLDRELQLNKIIMDQYIPQEYQDMIEDAVQWNEDIGEYQLRCVAYSGNNMRKQAAAPEKSKKKEVDDSDLSFMYLSYNTETTRIPTRQKSALPRKARSARPKSSRRPNVQSCDFDRLRTPQSEVL